MIQPIRALRYYYRVSRQIMGFAYEGPIYPVKPSGFPYSWGQYKILWAKMCASSERQNNGNQI